jgi:diguanylate cyclase (GGDEF)-like protein/PAS domain S-box-containing protein
MQRFVSIKSKLLLLLLATIILILLLVGLSLGYLIEKYYREEADKGFSRVFSELSAQLRERETSLISLAQRLSLRSDVVSGINMIYQYATPTDYLPLVYDGEKRKLAREFAKEARAGRIDEVMAYDANGELISYYSDRDGDTSGYLSYRDGAPLSYLSTDAPLRSWEPGVLPVSVAREISINTRNLAAIKYRGSGAAISAEYIHPVSRTYPDGKQLRVGYVLVRKYVTRSFIDELSKKTGIDVMLSLGAHVVPSDMPGVVPEKLGTINSTRVITESLAFSRHNLRNFFTAALALQLMNDNRAVFIAAVPKEVVTDAISNTRALVLLVLFFSAAVILPLGITVSHRAISRPLSQLTNAVAAVERGDYGARVALRSNDELGELSRAFNSMSHSIFAREVELVESENKYRNLVDNLPQRVFFKDRNSVYVSCNSQFASDLGIAPEEIVGKTDFDIFADDHARQYRLDDDRIMRKGDIEELEEPYKAGDCERVIQTVKTPIRNSEGEVVGILGIFWDITEKKQAEEKLRQSAAVFESTADGVMVTDVDNRIIAVNKAFTEITGYSESEALGKSPSFRRSERQDKAFYQDLWRSIERKGRWQGEIWNRRKSGEVYPEWMTISVVRDQEGRISNYVSVFSDITHVKQSQMQLDHMAHHDPLTDLPNRTLLTDRLGQAIRRALRSESRIAVLFIDLDRFKNVNDTLGHPTGDLLLQDVAQRLQNLLRQQDTIGRLGGDEFIILIEDLERPEVAESVATKVIDVLSSPFSIRGQELFIGASIGISLFPNDSDSGQNLIKYADAAMYRAKEQGRNNYQFYTQELTDSAMERLELESALRRALEREQFELYYQPQIDLASGEMVGAEALLRWHHPEQGMIPPDKFIPLAEDSGQIVAIGDWVLQQACRQAQQWCNDSPQFVRLAINLSAIQIQRGDITGKVKEALSRSGLPADKLELEITESVLMQYPEVAEVTLNGLREIGVELAIDDFGTGYSSLSYLKRFPIGVIKIDRSFVKDIPYDNNDTAITRAVIALGESLQMKIVAEGVESGEQAAFLLREGCDLAQGYYYSRPVPAKEMTALLESGALPLVTAGSAELS